MVPFWVCLFLFFPMEIKASQLALVKSERAIIYADPQLKIPLGFLRNGKLIRVGEVPKRLGKILPTIINGKIAYVQTKDLSMENQDSTSLENFLKDQDPNVGLNHLKENHDRPVESTHSFVMDYQLFWPGQDWEALTQNYLETSEGGKGHHFFGNWEYSPRQAPFKYLGTQIGLNYLILKRNTLEMKGAGVQANILGKIPLNEEFLFCLSAGLEYLPAVKTQIGSFAEESKLYGFQNSLLIRYSLNSDLLLNLGLGFYYLTTGDLQWSVRKSARETLVVEDLTFRGARLLLGLVWEI